MNITRRYAGIFIVVLFTKFINFCYEFFILENKFCSAPPKMFQNIWNVESGELILRIYIDDNMLYSYMF